MTEEVSDESYEDRQTTYLNYNKQEQMIRDVESIIRRFTSPLCESFTEGLRVEVVNRIKQG